MTGAEEIRADGDSKPTEIMFMFSLIKSRCGGPKNLSWSPIFKILILGLYEGIITWKLVFVIRTRSDIFAKGIILVILGDIEQIEILGGSRQGAEQD